MTQRAEIIAKLRDYDWRGLSNVGTTAYLSCEECKRIIADLEYAEWSFKMIEGGKVKIEDAVMQAYEAAQEWPKGQDR